MKQNSVSPLLLTEEKMLPSGMTESSHLANAYLTQPEMMESALSYAYGTQGDSVLAMLTGGISNVREVTNREYTWNLHGQHSNVVRCSADPLTTSKQPGLGGQEIRFKLPENRFMVSDNLVADNGKQVRVQDVKSDGINWIYTVVMASGSKSDWLDPKMIAQGAGWSKDYSTVEEYSSLGGGTNFSTPMKLTNQLTTLRKHFEVSRSAATDVMIIELTAADGKKTKLWTLLAEWNALAEWYREIDKALMYSVYNSNPVDYAPIRGANMRPVYTGAGLRQQISPSNIRYYNKLTYDILDLFVLDLSYAAKVNGGNVNLVALTGKMGLREFNDAISERQQSLGVTVTNSGTFITGSGSNLTLDGYFTTVKFMSNMSLTVREFPPYDDTERNRELHPETLKPLESYRLTILNFGANKGNGKANIRTVVKKDSENAMWHVCGSTDPYGKVAKNVGTLRSSGIDGYQVHMLAEFGIQVQDPTSCGELIMRAA